MTYYWTYVTDSDDSPYCGSTNDLSMARRMAEKTTKRLVKTSEWYRVQIMELEADIPASELAARLTDENDKLHNTARVVETWQG